MNRELARVVVKTGRDVSVGVDEQMGRMVDDGSEGVVDVKRKNEERLFYAYARGCVVFEAAGAA